MLKASELRIGNKFRYGSMVQTVFEIIDNTDRGKIKQLGYEVLIVPEENRNQYKPIEIHGLDITHQRLNRAGFKVAKYTDGNTYLQLDETQYHELSPTVRLGTKTWKCYRFILFKDEWHFEIHESNMGHKFCYQEKMQYIHELQNIYHAWSRQELIFKS